MTRLGSVLSAVAMALAVEAPAAAQSYDDTIEAFEATTVQMDIGKMTIVRIGITEWSTADERKGLIQAFQEGGSDAVGEFLKGQSEKGFVKFPNTAAYKMHYAWQIETEGKRVILMATDRPVTPLGTPKSLEKNLSMLKLVVDAEKGKGEGNMVAGARLVVDKEGQLKIEAPGTQPIRFTSVKQLNQKKKKNN